MNQQLNRYQVYLDRQDMFMLAKLAGTLKVSRSQLIRDATKAVALRYVRVASRLTSSNNARNNPLLDLIGIEKSRTGTVGLDVDDIYRT